MTLVCLGLGNRHLTVLDHPPHDTWSPGIDLNIFNVFTFHAHGFDAQDLVLAFDPDRSPTDALEFK